MGKSVTESELAQLPIQAVIAFATRAARRVQPLFSRRCRMKDRNRHLAAVDDAIRLSEAWLMRIAAASPNARIDAAHAADLARAAARAAGAHQAAAAANAAAAAALATRAADSTHAAPAASWAAECSERTRPTYEPVSWNILACNRSDFERLVAIAGSDEWPHWQTLDATEDGPLGLLWPSTPPDWYVEEKAKMDALLAKFRGREVFSKDTNVATVSRKRAHSTPSHPSVAKLAPHSTHFGDIDQKSTLHSHLSPGREANATLRSSLSEHRDPGASVMSQHRYQVALSFAGEDRPTARKLAHLLTKRGVSVFYDDFEQSDLWGKDLYQHLAFIYKDCAEYCIVLVSEYYASKMWTKHELRQIQARAFEESREYILPLKVDDTELPGMPCTVGYIDLRKVSMAAVVSHTLRKLRGETL